MLAGAVGATAVYAANENEGNTQDNEQPVVEETEESTDDEAKKEETVFVLANANGGTNKIIVSDHLVNADSMSSLKETSSLKDVQNVKGDETYTENGGERTWNAGGKDIYYQGTSTEELPIDITVKYMLDGKVQAGQSVACDYQDGKFTFTTE